MYSTCLCLVIIVTFVSKQTKEIDNVCKQNVRYLRLSLFYIIIIVIIVVHPVIPARVTFYPGA